MELEYNFDKFIDMYRKHSSPDTKTKNPFLHYYEDEDMFVLLFRNNDGVDTYTVVAKDNIILFGQNYTTDETQMLEDFRMNYLTDGIRVVQNPINFPVIMGNEEVRVDLNSDVELFKSDEVDAGEDVIEESEDYGDFIGKTIRSWESKVIAAIDKIELNKNYTPEMAKTFGEFITIMMNAINTVPFLSKIKFYIKSGLVAGMESAEEELGIQIGYTKEMQRTTKRFTQQQIDGYILPSGKSWHGIKGATKSMQVKILRAVNDGVQERKTIPEIKQDVKQVFDVVSESQADRIARTETNRFINEGKLQAYKDSGLEGVKVWDAVKPRGCKGCSPICDRLDGMKADLDGIFTDPSTGIQYDYPPSHVNCKSIILFEQTPIIED